MPIQFDRLSFQEDRLRQSGYRQLEPFFVLREGVIKDERTGGVVHLDRNRLMAIAAIQNNRIAETGDFTPIIVGHTKKGKKETEQPELTGWASRFEVAPFYGTNTWGLRAVPWSRPERVENFERYPRRSAELWTNPDLLDPISLLGANTPRLDLGVHRLQRDQGVEYYTPKHGRTGKPIHLEMDMPEPKEPTTDQPAENDTGGGGGGGKDSGLAAVFNSPEWQQLSQMVQEMAQVVMPLVQELKGGMGGGMPPGGGGGAPGPSLVPGALPPPEPGPAAGPMPMGGHPNPMDPMMTHHHLGGVHPHHHQGTEPGQMTPHHQLGDSPTAPHHMAGHPGTHPGMPPHMMHVQHQVTHVPPAAHVPLGHHAGHPMHHTGHPQQYAGHPAATHLPTHGHTHHMNPHLLNMGGGGVPGGTNTMMPTQLSRDMFQQLPPEVVAFMNDMATRLANAERTNAALQLSMIEKTVNDTLDVLEGEIVIDRNRDFGRLVQLSRADFDAEVAYMRTTRKPIEQPTPPVGVPLHMQANGKQAGRQPMGPIQLTLGQAHDLMEMPPDPAMVAVDPPQQGTYERLMEAVRNRGKGESALDAFDRYKKMTNNNGVATSVRG